MKKLVQRVLQSVLGFESYLFLFARFKIKTLKSDRHEKDFFHFLSLIHDDDNVLDIGANIGIMTVWLSRKCSDGTVFCFEPVPENIKVLQRIMKWFHLDNTKLFPVALGENADEVMMVMPEMSSVRMQGLSHVKHSTIDGYNNGKEFKVRQLRLDDVEELQKTKIGAIKIDVENYEQFVFRGGIELISRNRPIIYCELWPNHNRNACLELFRGMDYKVMVLENEKLVEYEESRHPQQNFFFVP